MINITPDEISYIHNKEKRMLTIKEAKKALEEQYNYKFESGDIDGK